MRRRGFALMASIWLTLAIVAVSLEVAWLTRTRRLATANSVEEDAARAAAQGGLEHARAWLTRALPVGDGATGTRLDPWRAMTGSRDSIALGTAWYRFALRDDGATLAVNRAGDTELQRLFAACGADAAAAARAAQRIADWRDGDDFPRAQGAERAQYLARGARALPRNDAVQRMDELDDVLDLPAAWQCVKPLLSVNGIGQVNVNTAPPQVLAALPGFSEAVVAAVIAARADTRAIATFQELLAVVPPALRDELLRASDRLPPWLTYDTFAERVIAEGWVSGSPVRVRAEALMVRGGGGTVFVQWREFR